MPSWYDSMPSWYGAFLRRKARKALLSKVAVGKIGGQYQNQPIKIKQLIVGYCLTLIANHIPAESVSGNVVVTLAGTLSLAGTLPNIFLYHCANICMTEAIKHTTNIVIINLIYIFQRSIYIHLLQTILRAAKHKRQAVLNTHPISIFRPHHND